MKIHRACKPEYEFIARQTGSVHNESEAVSTRKEDIQKSVTTLGNLTPRELNVYT